ncbi:tyrosine-type recombinase/integrase [Massilia aerilata]|uniref:Tyrosine-type recombinase/integrase n=1 Tax=Massilia aerilata TaxID=453817 RepID=A0ABW0RTY5_9BURK
MPFDAREAKLLEPGQHFTISECPGLRFEVSTSARSFIYRYKSPVDQRMRQVKIGEWPKTSISAATVEWEKLRDIRAAGRDPAVERRTNRLREKEERMAAREAASRQLTVRRLCNLYLEGHVDRNRNEKSAAETRRTLQKVLNDHPDFAELDPAMVNRAKAFATLEHYLDIPVQAGRIRAEFGAVWDYGHDAGRLDEEVPNWWRQIMRGKLRSKGHIREGVAIGTAKRVLKPDEIGTLLRWLPNFSRLVEDVVTLYMWTCTRGSEILAMERCDISREGDTLWWTIPKAKTKNSRRDGATDLRVPLVGRAEAIVKRRVELVKDGYLFPSDGRSGHVEQKTISAMVWMHQPYAKVRPEYERARLPVSHWSVHDLRRTGRTQLAVLSCPDEIAEAVLGHMPGGIVGVYNLHRYDKERREWLTRLSDHYEALSKTR